jgi:hypothetical protein
MPLVCIRSYLKLVPRYKFVVLDTYHPDTLYVPEQGCEDPLLFFEAKRAPQAKKLGKHCASIYNFTAILWLQYMVHIKYLMLLPLIKVLYFYISTFRSVYYYYYYYYYYYL